MSIPILRVTGVPAAPNNLDIRGMVVPENGLVLATPQGRVSVTAAWWGSMNPAVPANAAKRLPSPVIMTVTWAEAQTLCDALAGATLVVDEVTREALAAAAGQAVKDSLGAGGALEARLTAWAQSPEGRAALGLD